MKAILKVVLTKLSEKSTWAGVVVIAAALGVALSPENAALIGSIGAALAGAALVKMDEAPKT